MIVPGAAMAETYVTDITHFLDVTGELRADMPEPARKLASFLVLLIDAVSQRVPPVTPQRESGAGRFSALVRSSRRSCRPTMKSLGGAPHAGTTASSGTGGGPSGTVTPIARTHLISCKSYATP